MSDLRNDPGIPTLTQRVEPALPAQDGQLPVRAQDAAARAAGHHASGPDPATPGTPAFQGTLATPPAASGVDAAQAERWRAQVRQEIERALRPAVDAALDSLRRRLERELPALVAAAVEQHARQAGREPPASAPSGRPPARS